MGCIGAQVQAAGDGLAPASSGTAQRLQMQALPRCTGGTRASSSAEKRTLLHQHATSKRPQAATAQPLGPPHKGHAAWPNGSTRELSKACVIALFAKQALDVQP